MNMMKEIMIKKTLCMGLCVMMLTGLKAQEDQAEREALSRKYGASITAGELRAHLEVLASDAYEGRETGKPGQKKAAQYLADYYTGEGIAPGNGNSYLQPFPLKLTRNNEATVEVAGKTYRFADDFYFWGGFNSTELSLEQCVFAGYGIESPAYNDYADISAEGKVVVLMKGEPKYKGKSVVTGTVVPSAWAEDMEGKIMLAAQKGAIGVLIIDEEYDFYVPRVRFWLEQPMMQLDKPASKGGGLLPYAVCKESLGNALLASGKKKSIAAQCKAISKKGKPKSFYFTGNGIFNARRNMTALASENVLAFIEGSDPSLKEEIVVISAHYDHIGIVNGQINNGADDDGSGTVTTLEIAEAFATAREEGKGPRRSILFLHVSGEEKGLLGSEWYTEYPVYPLENTVCDLNIDMIGRKDSLHTTAEYVYLIGSDRLSTDLHRISEQCHETYASNLYLDYTYNDPNDPEQFYYRSDHYNFAKNNIPVIFYFTGVHPDYHKPGDDVEKIMFDKMETIARLIFHTAWEVANRDERLKVDVVAAPRD